MNEEMHRAEILDHFVDDVVADPTASRPPGLDADLADVARKVVLAERGVLADVVAPGDTIRARIWHEVMVAARDTPAGRRGWSPVSWPRLTPRLAGLTVVILLALGLGLFAWGERPQPVSAATIIARAEQATNDATAFGLPSYHGTLEGRSRPNATQPFQDWEQEVWFEAPAQRRVEGSTPPNAPPMATLPSARQTPSVTAPGLPIAGTENPRTVQSLYVTDGTMAWQAWQATPGHWQIERVQPYPLDSTAFDTNTLPGLLGGAGQKYDATLVNSERVAGRDAYVLDLRPRGGTATLTGDGRLRIWGDKETYIPLQTEAWDPQGNLLRASHFSAIQVNVPLDPDLFTFTPPPGVPVVDARMPPTPSTAELRQRWQDLARQIPYRLFSPGFVPPGLTPTMGPAGDTNFDATVLAYRSAASPTALVLIERRPKTDALGTEGQTVQVGTAAGRYREDNGTRWLVFKRDGTQIVLQGQSDVTREDLFRIAASLQPVSPASAAGP